MATDHVNELERAVRFNTRCTTGLLALFTVLVAGTCAYAYWRAQRLLQPERLVQTAERRIEEGYPEVRAELKRRIARSAPELAEKWSRRGLTSLPDARARVERYIEQKMDAGLEKATALSAEQFRQALRDNKGLIKEGFAELRAAPRETKQFAIQLEKQLEGALGADIQKQARTVLAFLSLVRGKLASLDRPEDKLTPAEQVERRMVRTLRAMQVGDARQGRASPAAER